jgi:competence protein ComEA
MSLPFIGGVKAERIIQYREDFGKFESIEELMKVSGIGPKTLEKLKPFVII